MCAVAAREVKQLAGYDRVMVYRFHPDWHGEVVAEEAGPGLEPFLGLHYPASDIPHQARKLYRLNQLRMIGDIDYLPVPILRTAGSELLDLSLSGLRSVSPIHLEYLRNMGVQATLTISLISGDRLWGMIACHHYSPRFIGPQVQSSCRTLAQVLGLRVVAQESLDNAAYRSRLVSDEARVLERMRAAESLAGGLATGDPSAVALTAAEGVVVHIDGRTAVSGAVPPDGAVRALLRILRSDPDSVELVCDDLPGRFGEMQPYAGHASGVLAIAVSPGYADYIIWFRGEWGHSVSSGN